MISPSPAVTLFTEPTDPTRNLLTLFASSVLHAGLVALISLGVLYPPVSTQVLTDAYVVRRLDLHETERPRIRAARGTPGAAAQQVAQALVAGRAPAPRLHVRVHAPHGAQTLLQPDLAVRLAQAVPVPVPQVFLWSACVAAPKVVVAPRPAPPTRAVAPPSLDAPSAEVNVADVNIASSLLPSEKLHILPSTTTPLAAPIASPVPSPPASATQTVQTPTPAAILSLSDLRMKDGLAVLPPLNETAQEQRPDSLTMGTGKEAGTQGQGGAAGAGKASQAAVPGRVAASSVHDSSARPGVMGGAAAGPAQGSAAGAALGEIAGTTQITLPKDGQFGAVVVGDSLEDQFPEMAGVWGGRMAYTVYLHVGLARSWILQYALPAAADAAQGGSIGHIQAPWPYDIVRPNLTPGSVDADAVLVHGFIDQAGRFDGLSVVFPQDFAQAPFVLQSLARWQFRPASENGAMARVEVLLIIPEELD